MKKSAIWKAEEAFLNSKKSLIFTINRSLKSYNTLSLSQGYYSFGSTMPGRNFSANNYRYGFNGKENDPEAVGTGSGTQDYGFRIYNPALGKFLSVDPLTKQYPELTPYQFASNRPIDGIDLDGLEFDKAGYIKQSDLIKRAATLKTSPEKINQGLTGTCVISAVTYLWINKNWNEFVGAAFSLYRTGKARVNNYEIVSQPTAQKLNPDTKGSSHEPGQIPQVTNQPGEMSLDWMMLSSIQNTQNEPFYGMSSETGGNDDESLKTLMTDLLGLTEVTQKYYASNKDTKQLFSDLTDMEYRNKQGVLEVISINANLLIPGGYSSQKHGGHSVVYAGGLKISGSGTNAVFTFDVISWGKQTTITANYTDMQKYFRGSTHGKIK